MCVYFCPEDAIGFPENTCGEWFISDTRFGPMVHARLGIAEENSGKLVTMVKQQGRLLALDEGRQLLIVDGPPGIGCPVIASLTGADVALIVAEPTLSGLHDFRRIADLTRHFNIATFVPSRLLNYVFAFRPSFRGCQLQLRLLTEMIQQASSLDLSPS